jgi:hypothetical protein
LLRTRGESFGDRLDAKLGIVAGLVIILGAALSAKNVDVINAVIDDRSLYSLGPGRDAGLGLGAVDGDVLLVVLGMTRMFSTRCLADALGLVLRDSSFNPLGASLGDAIDDIVGDAASDALGDSDSAWWAYCSSWCRIWS